MKYLVFLFLLFSCSRLLAETEWRDSTIIKMSTVNEWCRHCPDWNQTSYSFKLDDGTVYVAQTHKKLDVTLNGRTKKRHRMTTQDLALTIAASKSVSSMKSIAHLTPTSHSFEPPSTGMLAPVIQRAPSDATKVTTSATSSGLPIRFNACIPNVTWRPASVFAKFDMSVSIIPGAIAFTRMPLGPRMAAQCLTRVSIAPLVEA
jgi:hypothetical protein